MLDHLTKSSAMLPPASYVGMGDNANNLVGVPEYHYTQAWDQGEWDFQPFNLIATRMDPAKAAFVGEIERVRSATTVNQSALKTGPRCQVVECSADLTVGHKDYHARYRICEHCLKCPCVVRAGVRERFCQQCGRFHPVEAFDGDKRSCRDRLQRHNARRRKTKPAGEGSTLLTFQNIGVAAPSAASGDSTMTALPGQEMPPFKKPHIQPLLAGLNQPVRLNWVPAPRPDPLLEAELPDMLVESGGLSSMFKGIQSPNSVLSNAEGNSTSSNFDETVNNVGCVESALSLSNDISNTTNMLYRLSSLGSTPDLMPQCGEMSKLEYKAYNFQVGPPDHSEYSMHDSFHTPSTSFLDHSMPYSMGGSPTCRAMSGVDESIFSMDSASIKQEPGATYHDPMSKDAIKSFQQANNLVNLAMGYQPVNVRQRMSTKMMDCTPEQLPLELKLQLMSLLQCGQNDLDAYIRPGCVHLTVNMSLEQGCPGATNVVGMGARAAANGLLQGSGSEFWASRTLLVQLNNEVALVKGGKVLRVLDGYASQGVYPTIDRLAPLCVSSKGPASVKLYGINLRSSNNVIIARCQGLHATLKAEEAFTDDMEDAAALHGADDDDEEEIEEEVTVKLPSPRRNGAMQIEMMHGGYMSSFKSVLVLDNDEAVDEINSITPDLCTACGLDLESFLLDLDNLLELQNTLAAPSAERERLRKYSAADYQRLAVIGRRVFVLALSQGWPALARLVLPVAVMGQKSVQKTIEEMHTISRGLSLLHLAVRSKNPKMVTMLLEWSSANNCEFSAALPGPNGITPLHMAAILQDGGEMAALLTVLCMDGRAAWGARSNGLTPFDMAKLAGTDKDIQARLTETVTATHRAQEEVYVQTLQEIEGDEYDSEYEDDDEGYEIDPETGEVINLDQFAGVETKVIPAPDIPASWGPPPTKPSRTPVSGPQAVRGKPCDDAEGCAAQKPLPPLPAAKRELPKPDSSKTGASSACTDNSEQFKKIQEVTASDEPGSSGRGGASGSVGDGLPEDLENEKPWKQGETSKQQPSIYRPDPLYGDNICMVDVNGNAIVPTVFDRMSASCSGLLITLIGGATLACRYSFDCLAD